MFGITHNKKLTITSDLSAIADIVGRSPVTISRWLDNDNEFYRFGDYDIYVISEHIKSKRGGREFKTKSQ